MPLIWFWAVGRQTGSYALDGGNFRVARHLEVWVYQSSWSGRLSDSAVSRQLTRRAGSRVVSVPWFLVIRTYETSSEGELLSDTVISVPV